MSDPGIRISSFIAGLLVARPGSDPVAGIVPTTKRNGARFETS
jgi:hypothetical protein